VNFDQAAEYLQGLTRLGIKLGNERFEALLDRLGNPHRKLRPIHIAGTKGKGSTSVFASSALRAAGYRVGTYLSPFVYDLRERVQVDGEMIPREDFARLVTTIQPVADDLAETELGPTTEFELKTAVGFCYFAEQAVDIAVVEVGLGGRLDATNVLPNPLVSVITNIGYDHTNLLGETLTEIAGEKAGIVKPHGICVTGSREPEALARIEEACREREAELIRVEPGVDWDVDETGAIWVRTPKRDLRELRLGLLGDFQQANAAVAAHALDRAAGITISDDQMRTGLASARLPGRFETIRSDSPAVVVDAAHNAMAAEALAQAVERLYPGRSLIVVAGMSKGHEPLEFLSELLKGFDLGRVTLIATEPEFRPRAASEVADAAREVGVGTVLTVPAVVDAAGLALDLACQTAEETLVLVTGSFYTIGELPPRRWQEIFGARGLNTPIPANLWENRMRVNL
jgi:dihydrofolate synthase/folylpolyglutamate synthase